MMAGTEKIKYLIIGNSAGGIGAAEAIREVDRKGTLAIISDEPYSAYSRPLISEHLAEGCPMERMLYRPADFYKKNNIQLVLGRRVAQVMPEEHMVRLEGGRVLGWRKLLLAAGGQPVIPDIEGAGVEGVFTFNKLDDARAIDAFLRRYRRKLRAVVIGGGLIGVSVTEALVKRGVEVTIVEMKARILNTILDQEASDMEKRAIRHAGAEVITGHTVSRIGSYLHGEVTSVVLDNSRPIPCELVIIAVGVQPRLELVEGSAVRTNRGIVVDRRMATSAADVYACGDVAEAYDFIYKENRLTPVWPNACAGGRVAGLNMAGVPADYRGGTAMNAVKYFGVNIVSAGMVTPPDESYEVVSYRKDGNYRKVILKNKKIAGLVFAGDIEKSGIVYNLMRDRVDVRRFRDALVADDFGLAAIPEKIWQPRLAVLASSSATPVALEEAPEALFVEG